MDGLIAAVTAAAAVLVGWLAYRHTVAAERARAARARAQRRAAARWRVAGLLATDPGAWGRFWADHDLPVPHDR
jgi:hypothetical protein